MPPRPLFSGRRAHQAGRSGFGFLSDLGVLSTSPCRFAAGLGTVHWWEDFHPTNRVFSLPPAGARSALLWPQLETHRPLSNPYPMPKSHCSLPTAQSRSSTQDTHGSLCHIAVFLLLLIPILIPIPDSLCLLSLRQVNFPSTSLLTIDDKVAIPIKHPTSDSFSRALSSAILVCPSSSASQQHPV